VPPLPKKGRLDLHTRLPLPSADTVSTAVAVAARPPVCTGLSAVSYAHLRHTTVPSCIASSHRPRRTHARSPSSGSRPLALLLWVPLQGLSDVPSTPAALPEGRSASARRLQLPRSFRPRGFSPPRRLAPRDTHSEERGPEACELRDWHPRTPPVADLPRDRAEARCELDSRAHRVGPIASRLPSWGSLHFTPLLCAWRPEGLSPHSGLLG